MDANFRSRVEALLHEKGMTQRELAARLGVSEVTVSRWMTSGVNGRSPNVKTLQKIADILETTPDDLLGRSKRDGEMGDTVSLGTILAGTALTATSVIGIVALAKAMGKLTDKDKAQIEDILSRDVET